MLPEGYQFLQKLLGEASSCFKECSIFWLKKNSIENFTSQKDVKLSKLTGNVCFQIKEYFMLVQEYTN